VDTEHLVVGDVQRLGGVAPARHLLLADAQLAGAVRVATGGVGGGAEVLLGHQVGVDIVVTKGAVFVRAGDPVDVEPALGIVAAQGTPQPRGLSQQLQATARSKPSSPVASR